MSLQEKYHVKKLEKLEYDIREEVLPIIENLTQTKIQDIIGTGGFSIVKLAYKASENKFYALKVVSLIFNLL